MAQNIYDDPEFFAGYARLDRSRQGLDATPEWPALRALLPDPSGLRIADLGCGYGWFCRWAAERGAASVLGLDVSEKMLERARSFGADARVTYRRTDLEQLDLPAASFDLVYSSLAFHYVADVASLFRAIRTALVPGGPLVFSTEHPIYMAARRAGWIADGEGRKSWPVDSYQMEGKRITDWLAPGVVKYHRTLGTTLNALIAQGFAIRHVEEWGPTDAQVAAQPQLAEERDRPTFLLVAAQAGDSAR
jgi:SAM-dependent methyltransferase